MKRRLATRRHIGIILLGFAFGLGSLPRCAAAQAASNPPSSNRRYPLPSGIGQPIEIFFCPGGEAILFWARQAKKSNAYTLYAFEYETGRLKELLHGSFGHTYPAPVAHLFALDTHDGDQGELVILDDGGQVRGRWKHPDPGAYCFPSWSPDGSRIACQQNRPHLGPNSRDYDPFGFTAITLITVDPFRTSWFPVHPTGYGHTFVGPEDKPLICVTENQEEDPGKKRIGLYDLNGRKRKDSEAAQRCAFGSRRYYASRQPELPTPFRIYATATHRVLKRFAGTEARSPAFIVRGDWNPRNDDLLVIEHRDNANEITALVVYRISDDKILKKLPGSAYTWTPDGSALIVFQRGAFVFEPAP